MLKKISAILFSTRLMAMLFVIYALAMIIGTFIESAYNTDTARILVYNAWWFEAILLFFVINFVGNIKRYQLYKKEKWATLMLHLSFILIIVGAGITRYISFEGMMPIRENATENKFFSDKTFITVLVDGMHNGAMARKSFERPVIFSQALQNGFSLKNNFDTIDFSVTKKEFIMGAKQTVVPDKDGEIYLKLVESSGGTRHEHFLKSGEVQNIHNLLFSLNKFTQGAVNIITTGKEYTVNMPFEGNFMRMADKMQGKVIKNTIQPLMMRSLYNVGNAQFVFPDPAVKGKIGYQSSNDYKGKNQDDAVVLIIKNEGKEKEVTLVGSKGKVGDPVSVKVGSLEYTLFYGSKAYELPFGIKLKDFEAQKYPGTEKSYSSYESKVSVIDKQDKIDARIYMNNVLDYKGYRFFQASFDPDEQGTILSVNHDFWGTWITYIGYFFLYFAMMAIMFTKDARFADLKRKLEKVKEKKSKLITILLIFFSLNALSQAHLDKNVTQKQLDSLLTKYKVSEAHAAKFAKLVIQDLDGRMKPVNTFSSLLLRKVSHADSYNGMNSDQVFISMAMYRDYWLQAQIIYIKPANDSIRKLIGVDPTQKFAKFIDFFDAKGNYKLAKYLENAYKVANPNAFEKDIVETDKKINLMNSAVFGNILKIIPIPNDKNNKWVSYPELSQANIKGKDSIFTKNIIPAYFIALSAATQSNNYKEADYYLSGIQKYQNHHGSKVMPTPNKIDTEITYNKLNVLQKLPYWYLFGAIVMIILVVIQIFKDNKLLRISINILHLIIGLLFALHTLDLMFRWYISGHAPWSDGYEAMVYVAWSTMLFGLAFDMKSKLTIASSAFVASMILMASSWQWVDPQIANLQPVLNSYWLMIHVAVIVASYGPFALGMILGFVSLLLITFTTKSNKEKMNLNIQEITYINEMALTIGLIMLTIGNFLGGQWANESWGRYWGWDPKETWALISIVVYAFVIHARFVPSMRNKWIFNLMAMYAFISILFTYYGVNFHLVGLHSYASGEAKSLSWIYYSFAGISLMGFISYFKYVKFYKK